LDVANKWTCTIPKQPGILASYILISLKKCSNEICNAPYTTRWELMLALFHAPFNKMTKKIYAAGAVSLTTAVLYKLGKQLQSLH